MSNNSPKIEMAERVDRLCDQFESAFRNGEKPSIEAFLMTALATDRPELLASLVTLERELRTSSGEIPQLEDYRRRFPRDVPTIDSAWNEMDQSSRKRVSAADTLQPKSSDTSVGSNSVPAPPASQIPKTFGRFEIIRQLGRGACGVVYLARDPKLDRNVALKVPHGAYFMSESDQKRFIREAKAAAGLSHPNICRVYEVSEAEGHDFIVMEFVEGKPLDDYITRGRISMKQGVQVVRKLAMAFAEAHRQGIVHRDIKPSNVMVNLRGEPVIMDFGLARIQRTMDSGLTQSGMLIGTPAYMSPEQARGAVDEIGPASDIYSLGVVLYVLLCGQRPFSGTILEVIGQTLSDNAPPPPSRHRADIPAALDAICMKAIAKPAKDRFASMKEFADALNQYLKFVEKPAAWEANAAAVPRAISVSPTRTKHAATEEELDFDVAPRRLSTRSRRKATSSTWLKRLTGNGARIAAAAGFLSALILGAVVYYVVTNKGAIVVEVADKEVEAKLGESGLIIEDKASRREYTIKQSEERSERPGNFRAVPGDGLRLIVKDDNGLEIPTNEFKLTRGGAVRIRVTLKPEEENAQRDQAPPASKPEIKGTAPDRKAAEWLLKQKAHLAFVSPKTGARLPDAGPGNELPSEPFYLEGLDLWGKSFPPTEIENLRGLQHLQVIVMHGSGSVDDRGLAVIAGIPSITRLSLGANRFTGKGLSVLPRLKNLENLGIRENSNIDNAAMRYVAACRNLTGLDVGYTSITDDGVKTISTLPQLKGLGLSGTRISGAAIDHLAHLPNLTSLNVERTKLRDVDWVKLAQLKTLTELRLTGVEIGDTGIDSISKMTELKELSLGETRVTDEGLKSLGKMTGLRQLVLVTCPKVTESGIKELHASIPKCRIEWDGGIIEPNSVATSNHIENKEASAKPPADVPHWTDLFNGKDLTGWSAVPLKSTKDPGRQWWAARPQERILESLGEDHLDLQTASTFRNFTLQLEWRFTPGGKSIANGSGIIVRVRGLTTEGPVAGSDPKGIEIDLRTNPATARNIGTGCFLAYGTPLENATGKADGIQTRHLGRLRDPDLSAGDGWNICEVTCEGDRITVHMNGAKISEAWGAEVLPGAICLRNQQSAVQFRNIRIRELERPSNPVQIDAGAQSPQR